MISYITMRDYHIHTSMCGHAEGRIAQYVESAIERGLTEICFAEHIPFPDRFDEEHRMKMDQVDFYFEEIERCRGKYREITILAGIEADYIEQYEKFLDEFLSSYPFDMVAMSIHFVPGWPGDDWVFRFEYTPETLEQKYGEYFDTMLKGIKTGLFDMVAHLDIVKRPDYPVLSTNEEDIDIILQATKDAGMSIELNTSGLRKEIKQTYPSLGIIKRAVAIGIPIVLSSDAHRPMHVGYQFDPTLNRLFGFPGLQFAKYRQRRMITQHLSQS